MENVENAIFGPPDFKIFWGNMPSRPPFKPRAFVTHFQVTPLENTLDAVPDSGVQDSPPCVSIPMG